jgi:peroxiredoxin
MVMMRCFFLGTGAFVLLPALVSGGAPSQDQSEREMLAGLRKLAQPLDAAAVKGKDEDEIRALVKRRAESALDLVQKLEAAYPDSSALNTARSEALKAAAHLDDDALIARAVQLAGRLKKGVPKGSDQAAEAELYILGQQLRKVLKGANTVARFKEVWNEHAEQIRQKAAEFLDAYPKYRTGADAVNGLVRLAETAEDEKTPRFVREAIARHFPDHPAARVLARERAVGKELDFAFTPIGAETASRLKDLRGKVVVIAFWASWCVPCRADLADLKERYAKYRADGLEIVGISLDEKDQAARRYLKKHDIPGIQVVGAAARKLGQVWGVEHLPMQFVVDRQGRLRSVEAVGRLDKLIPELLAEK